MNESIKKPRSKNLPAKLAAAILALGLGGGGTLCLKSFDQPEIVRALPAQEVGNGKPNNDPLGDVNAHTRGRIGEVAGVLGSLIIAAERRAKIEPPIPPYEKELYDILLRFAESGDITEFNEFMERMENVNPPVYLYGILSRVLDRIPSNGSLMKKIVTSCIGAEYVAPPSICANAVMRVAGMKEMRKIDGGLSKKKIGGMDAILKEVFEQGSNHYTRSMAMAAMADHNYVLGMANHAARLGMETQEDRDFADEVARGLVMNPMVTPEQQAGLDSMINDPRTNGVIREAAVESSSNVGMLNRYAFMDNAKCDAPRYQNDSDKSLWQIAYDNDQLRFAARRRLRDMGLLPEADFRKGIAYTYSD